MKALIGLVGLGLVSAVASADITRMTGEFEGHGMWKMPDGSHNTWKNTMTFTKADNGVTVKEVLSIQYEEGKFSTMENTWTAQPVKNGFFDIITNGKKTGSGVCFKKVCHLQGEQSDGGMFTETFEFNRHIVLSGFTSAEKYSVAYRGGLRKVK